MTVFDDFSRIKGAQRNAPAARRFARRVFLVYCCVYYFLPFIIFVTTGNPLEDYMVRRPSYLAGITYVIVAIILFYIATSLPTIRFHTPQLGLSRVLFHAQVGWYIAAFFLIFSIWSRSYLGLNFRQSGVALAEVGAIGFLLEILKVTCSVMLIVNYRMITAGCETSIRSMTLILIGLGFFFSIQAAFDIFFMVCALIASGVNWARFFGLHLKFVRTLSIILLPVLLYLALFIGIANKIGTTATLALSYTDFMNLFMNRIGYHFYSTSIHVTDNFVNFTQFSQAIGEVWHVTQYRLSVLLGFGGVEKPDVGTISRMNYLYMSPVYHPRIGASPSILGSVFFWPWAGFAIIYFVFIIRYVLLILWDIIGPLANNWLFLIFTMILMASVLDASLDSLNPLSHGAVRFVLLVMAARYVVRRLGYANG